MVEVRTIYLRTLQSVGRASIRDGRLTLRPSAGEARRLER